MGNEIDPGSKKVALVYGGTSLSEAQKEMIKVRVDDFALGMPA